MAGTTVSRKSCAEADRSRRTSLRTLAPSARGDIQHRQINVASGGIPAEPGRSQQEGAGARERIEHGVTRLSGVTDEPLSEVVRFLPGVVPVGLAPRGSLYGGHAELLSQ